MFFSRTLLKRHSVLPGFDLALGFTLLYLGLIVLVPLSAAFLKTFTMTWPAFWDAVTSPRVVASYRLTFGASLAAALLNILGQRCLDLVDQAPTLSGRQALGFFEDALEAMHLGGLQSLYVTLSARANTLGGIVRPICFAAFRLMMNSNFVGCSTGRSAGLAPLRILSTYVAARRARSLGFAS